MNARDEIVEVMTRAMYAEEPGLAFDDYATAALAALESSGYTVAKLKQVGCGITVDAQSAKFADGLYMEGDYVFEDGENFASPWEPLFRIVQVDDQERSKENDGR